MSGHGPKLMPMTPSRFQWHKFKDSLHYFTMVALIPMSALIFYVNVFIGPAELTEIPEGYEPEHWEYHRVSCESFKVKLPAIIVDSFQHPITRFMAQYIYPSPQQEYEKMLHNIWEEQEKMNVRRLEKQIRAKMAERNDYQAYYYKPSTAKYHRVAKQAADELDSLEGDN